MSDVLLVVANLNAANGDRELKELLSLLESMLQHPRLMNSDILTLLSILNRHEQKVLILALREIQNCS